MGLFWKLFLETENITLMNQHETQSVADLKVT